MLHRVTKYMNIEGVVIASGGGPKKCEKYEDSYLDKGRKAA